MSNMPRLGQRRSLEGGSSSKQLELVGEISREVKDKDKHNRQESKLDLADTGSMPR